MFVVTVTSLRWIASAAAGGPSSLSLWVLAILCFFIPQGLAVADLSARFPEEGGLYRWTKLGFGDFHGFVCGWCYWVNNLLYFPSLLIFICATLAFSLVPLTGNHDLESNPTYVVSVTLGILWLVAGLSFLGLRYSKWLQDIGGIGNWIPAALVATLGLWIALKYGSANAITPASLMPSLFQIEKISFFSQLCFALAGLELASFVGSEIDNPRVNFVRALIRASFFILFAYLLGTWGILVTIPQERITAVNGVILPLIEFGHKLGWPYFAPVCGFMIVLGGLGTTLAWFSGAARVPYLVGVDRYLPSWLAKQHPRWGTPHYAILVQALLSTLFTLFATYGSGRLELIYKILVDMCLILYFIPYLYLFSVMIRLRHVPGDPQASEGGVSLSPRSRKFTGWLGLATTALAIVMTLIPTSGSVGVILVAKTFFGTAAMIGIGLFFFLRHRQTQERPT